MPTKLRQHEFFSGIGGMRLAIPDSIEVERCTAYDTSLIANEVYDFNFKEHSNICVKLVEQLKIEDVDDGADLWTMSPPCQPFTTTQHAHRRGLQDNRTKGFVHLMYLLENMKNPPQYIVLENVKGFLGSDAIKRWIIVLKKRGYSFLQILISPIQIGIPNNRTRLYMLCERSSRFAGYEDVVIDTPDGCEREYPGRGNGTGKNNGSNRPAMRRLAEYLEDEAGMDAELRTKLLISREMLAKPWMQGMSIVGPLNTTTFCFTASYSKTFHKSSGSLLHSAAEFELSNSNWDRATVPNLHGKLRLFSPKELLNLFGFPGNETEAHFHFPPTLTLRNSYHAVGNSLNVTVVRMLMGQLFEASWTPRLPPGGYPSVVSLVEGISSKSWSVQEQRRRTAAGRRRAMGVAAALLLLLSKARGS